MNPQMNFMMGMDGMHGMQHSMPNYYHNYHQGMQHPGMQGHSG
jgi:hypothetical protein